MPDRAKRPCGVCGATTAGKYCAAHAGEDARRSRQYDRDRAGTELRRLYQTALWQRTRKAVLARDTICKKCRMEPSTVVHHVIDAVKYVAQHGVEAFFDETNLQGLGKACHNAETARRKRTRGVGVGDRTPSSPRTVSQPRACVSRSADLA